jgi:hypothetical protein
MTHIDQMTTPKTIDYHHLDMSKDDGTDEHGIDWLCGCQLHLKPQKYGMDSNVPCH